MKKLLIAFAFLLITIFVNRYTDIVIDINTITLIGMGLALFVAFSFAELGKVIGLPMVTGFILTGLALGPELGNLLSLDVVNRLKMFNTLAIGIIALSAGIELDLKSLGKDAKSLATTIFGKIFFLIIFIAPVVYFYETKTHFFGFDDSKKIVMAILFSVFGIGTSPAIVLAILSETKAKGRVSSLVLNNAILKDFIVVIVLAVALGFCTSFLSGEKVSFDAIANLVGREIGLSLVFGLLFGSIIIFYLKYVNVDTLLFIVAMILVVAEISQIYHLEFLLVLIGAGALVKNTTQYADELHHLLVKVSLPVFIIFFTNAGAAIQIGETLKILPLALLIVAFRALALFCSARISSNMTNEKSEVRKNIWLGYIPQAGVTLGLIEIAAQRIPSMASDIYLLGLGVISINLILGPIALKIAFKNSNEIPDETEDGKVVSQNEDKDGELTKVMLPKFDNHFLANPEKVSDREIKLEKYQVIEVHIVSFINGVQQAHGDLLDSYINNLKEVTQGFVDNNKFDEYNEKLKHEYICKNIKNIGHLYHQLNKEFVISLQAIYKLNIQKVPARCETDITTSNIFNFVSTVKKDVPLQILLKTFTRDEFVNANLMIAEKISIILGNALVSYFENPETSSLFDIYKKLEEILKIDLSNLRVKVSKNLNSHLGNAVEKGISKKQALSKTNPKIILQEERIKEMLFDSSKYFDSISNYRCLNENIKYFKENINLALHQIFYDDLGNINSEIKNNSAPIFIIIERLKKIFQTSNISEESELKKIEFDDELIDLGIKINPYLLENKFRLELRKITHSLINIDLMFDVQTTRCPTTLSDLKYKRVDLLSVVRQIEILEFLPRIEKQLEELFEVIERVKFEYVEAVGIVKSLSMTVSDISEQGKKSNHQQLDLIRRSLSTELAHLSDAYNDFVHGSSKLSLSTIDSLEVKIYQGKLAANTVGKVGYAINTIRDISRKIIPLLYLSMKKVLFRVMEETSVIHSPDKVLFNRGRIRAVSKDFKVKIDALLSVLLFKENKKISDFYRECFSLEPIRSSSNMITNKKILSRIFEHEAEWQKLGHLKMIVIHGSTGSGKTSLLNVLQNEMATQDILRISDDYDSKRTGLYSLVLNYLKISRKEYKVILLDNIDHWVKKSIKSEEDFKKFINLLMLNKDKNIMIVCTINKLNVDFLNSTYNLDLLASRTYSLEAMNVKSLRELIEYRQWQSGQSLYLKKAINLPVIGQGLHFKSSLRKILDKTTSIRGCLTTWLYLIDYAMDGHTKIDTAKDFDYEKYDLLISYLPNEVYLVYRYFFHFGESNIQEITRSLLLDRDHVSRCLNYLVNAGILLYNPKCHRYDLEYSIRAVLENRFVNNLVLREGESYGGN